MDIQLRSSNIYLIGMMGTGKTTVGKLLAEKLDYDFFDPEDCIEKLAQKTIAEIFANEGEARFRALETQTLKQVSSYRRSAFTEGVPLAIATGGGIVEQPENWNYLRQGLTFWLDADLNLLQQRLAEDKTRPLLAQLESLFASNSHFGKNRDLVLLQK